MKYFLIILFSIFTYSTAHTQQLGCTDPQAANFNASATANDGSCIYDSKSYTPALRANLSNTLREISGMIYFNEKLLALNDGGGGNKLYFLDTSTGAILQTITVESATNIDWEDLAQDSAFVYVGDFGNNNSGNRTDLCIYKIDKNAFDQTGDFTIPAVAVQKISFSYPDQTSFLPTGANNTAFDCEALLLRRGRLHLFTKNWIGNYSVHYSLPTEPGTHVAKRLDSLNTGNILITGADLGGDDEILMTGYSLGAATAFYLVYGFDSSEYFFNTGNRRKISLPSVLTSGQLEAVCFVNATHGFIANEYFSQSIFNVSNKLRLFNSMSWIIDYYANNPKVFDATPGMLRFNSTTNQYEIYTGVLWEVLNE